MGRRAALVVGGVVGVVLITIGVVVTCLLVAWLGVPRALHVHAGHATCVPRLALVDPGVDDGIVVVGPRPTPEAVNDMFREFLRHPLRPVVRGDVTLGHPRVLRRVPVDPALCTAGDWGQDAAAGYVGGDDRCREGLELLLRHTSLPPVDPAHVDVPVVFINMDRHRNRRAFMEDQLRGVRQVHRQVGVVATRAIPGQTLGETGCTLAHRAAWQHVVDAGWSRALILEDDASLRLSAYWPMPLSRVPMRGVDVMKLFGHFFWSATAYLVTREGARKLLREFREVPKGIDFAWREWATLRTLNNWVYPYNVDLPSTIDTLGGRDAEDGQRLDHLQQANGVFNSI